MSEGAPTLSAAYRRLERALVRRRLTGLERRLAIEIAALVALVWGFLFWQSSVALAALARTHGPMGVTEAIAAAWVAIAITVGAIAGAALARALRGGLPGLPWLSLPIPASLVLRHAAWDARVRALWPSLLAPPILAGGAGLVPPWWLALLAATLVWLVIEASRLGCAVAWRLVLHETEVRPAPPLARLFDTTARSSRVAACPPPRWRRSPRWIALWRKDALLSARSRPVRRRLIAALVPAALSAGAWWMPLEPGVGRLLALALALVSAAAIGDWLIALAKEDPFALLRAQPCDLGSAWSARAAWAALGAVLVGGVQLAASHALPMHARQLFGAWVAGVTFVIALLAVHYGLTLYPRVERATHMLTLTLGLAMAASLMIPLAGWVVLLTALVHSARRLPRWVRLDPMA